MKFIVSSGSLLKKLQSISGVINTNNTLPIIDNVLFEIEEKNLSLKATDLECTMISQVNLESAEENGSIAMNGKLLIDTLKTFPEQPLTFVANDTNNTLDIISEQGKYTLSFIHGEEFPTSPELTRDTGISIPAKSLEQKINKTIFAAGNDELRPVISGVLCEIQDGILKFVATDAHKLVKYETKITTSESASFILPKKPLQIIKTLLNSTNQEVLINYDDSNVIFVFNEFKIYCRLIDGSYPNYNAVIPKENQNKIVIERNILLQSLKRVCIFSNKSTNQIRVQIKGNEIQISAEDISFSNKAIERLSCQYDGEDMEIGFNGKFLIDLLSALDSDAIRIEMSTPSKAVNIFPSEQKESEDILMLIMPIMLSEN